MNLLLSWLKTLALEPFAKVILLIEKGQSFGTSAPYPSVPFPRWGQGNSLRHSIILPPPGEGCPKDRKGAFEQSVTYAKSSPGILITAADRDSIT
jgi:hypothetical protein